MSSSFSVERSHPLPPSRPPPLPPSRAAPSPPIDIANRRNRERIDNAKTVQLAALKYPDTEELSRAKPLAQSCPNARPAKESKKMGEIRTGDNSPIRPAPMIGRSRSRSTSGEEAITSRTPDVPKTPANSPRGPLLGSARTRMNSISAEDAVQTRSASGKTPPARPSIIMGGGRKKSTHEELLKIIGSHLAENPEVNSTEGSARLVDEINLNGPRGTKVRAHDGRGNNVFNLFHKGHLTENLNNTYRAIEDFLDHFPTTGDPQALKDLKERLIAIKNMYEFVNIPGIRINTDIDNPHFAKDAKNATHQGNMILGKCFSEMAAEMGISLEQLEEIVGRFNSKSIGKEILTTIYELEIDGKKETFVEIAEPQSKNMHTSADRSVSDISNFFKRSVYKVEQDGSFSLTELGCLKTHSCLPTITEGKLNKVTGETTKDLERFKGSMNAFEQVLDTTEPMKDKDGNYVIKLTQATLFTAAKERVDKGLRKMESEWLMLQETVALYNLYDGQFIERTIDGKLVKIKVEIEHINAGTNKYATSEWGILLDKTLEKSVNDQGISKALSHVQTDLAIEIPPHLKAELAKCQQDIDNAKAELSAQPPQKSLRDQIKEATTEKEFGALRTKNRENREKLSKAYGKMIEIHQKIYEATRSDQTAILKEEEKNLTRLEKLLSESTPAGRAEIQKQIDILKNKVAMRQLSLEIQDLYYSGSYRQADNIHNLQLGIMLLGVLRENNVCLNCKSGEDRTGRMAIIFNLAMIAYKQFNRFPNLSQIVASADESDPQNKANRFFDNHSHHRHMLQFGIAAQINNANSRGAGGLQIEAKTNRNLGELAKASKNLAATAKTPYKEGEKIKTKSGPTDPVLAKELSESLKKPKEAKRRSSDLDIINQARRSSRTLEAEGRNSLVHPTGA